MNNLTTIAALPSGGGCMASLPPEKAEARPAVVGKFEWSRFPSPAVTGKPLSEPIQVYADSSLSLLAALGYCVKDGVVERIKAEKSWGAFEPEGS